MSSKEKYWVCFENNGEISVNAFKLLGASSKREQEGKIGFYGTGLKYALAVLLREDVSFKIYSGLKEIKVGTVRTQFLDKKIPVLTINGEKTSITVEAGIDWEPWYAIREIYSNTLDEGGKMSTQSDVNPRADITRIYVDPTSPAMSKVFNEWGKYFSSARTSVFQCSKGTILEKMPGEEKTIAYRRGIKAYDHYKTSVFDYDLEQLDINESRVAKYGFQVGMRASELIALSGVDIIEKFLSISKSESPSEYFEWSDEFWGYLNPSSFSAFWPKVLSKFTLVPYNTAGRYELSSKMLVIPTKLLTKLKDRFGDLIDSIEDQNHRYMTVKKTEEADAIITKQLKIFATNGILFDTKEVHIVKFHDPQIKGMAEENRVLLSDELFTPALQHLAGPVLLEEVIHCNTSLSDLTRGMQDYLFQIITNLMGKVAGSADAHRSK